MEVFQPKSGLWLNANPALLIDATILELLPAAVYVCDADGRIARYNRKASELWGRSPQPGETEERFCGSHRLFWPDGRSLPHDRTPMAQALRTGEPVRDQEVVIEQPSGTRVHALVNIDPIRNEAGETIGAINCFQDITARRQAEGQARASRELFQAVVETTPECVKIVAQDGRLLLMNAAGLRMIEAPDAGSVLGRCAFDLIAPEYRDTWKSHHARVCAGESLTWSFDIIGLGGQRRHMETQAVPLMMPDGTVAQLGVTRDTSERYRYEEMLRDRERHLRNLLEALPAAVYTTDAEGRITFYNQAAVDLWGRSPEMGEQWCGSWHIHWPDGTPMPHDQCPMARAIKEGRALRNAEAMLERPDGTRTPFLASPTPLRDASDRLVGAVNMLMDITDIKQAEQRQRLLINELNHRVKNTLAAVRSIAAHSFRGTPDDQARKWFEGRLAALAMAHDVLTRESWEGADLRDVVRQALAPLRGRDGSHFDIDGPDLRLRPKMALSLAMVLHELCTNAAKYGALSNDAGRVTVEWQVVEGSERRFHLRWAECGGPPVEPPQRQGFGTRLIERSLSRNLDARVRLDFAPSGLVCEIDAPLTAPGLTAAVTVNEA